MKNTSVNNGIVKARRARGGFADPAEPDADDVPGASGKGYDPAEPDADDKLPPHNNGSAADRARAHRAVSAKKGGKNAKAMPFQAKGGNAARDLQKPVGAGGGVKDLPVGKKTLT